MTSFSRSGLVALSVVLPALLCANPAYADCATWNPLANQTAPKARSITARDLIELVNFGRPDYEPLGDAPLGLSPDGRFVATVLQRADLASNGMCQALVVIDLTGRSVPRVLDRGGEFLMTTGALRSMYMSIGVPRLDAARWSGDGRSIAYLKRSAGRTQIWRVTLDGKPATQVTRTDADVGQWTWSADGRSLVYSIDDGRAEAEAAIDREGRDGWHYDERMAPHIALRPQIPAPLPEREIAIDPETGATSPVSQADHDVLALGGEQPMSARRRNAAGFTAWVERAGLAWQAPRRLMVRDAAGSAVPCTAQVCAGGFEGLWWTGDGRSLLLLTREGWNNRYSALYRWRPGHGQPERLIQTDDVIEGCLARLSSLVCLRQGSLQPPRIVEIAADTGRQRIVFDPNPSYSKFTLGSVQRLEWATEQGRPVYGDLVLPAGYKGGRLPVIVTQYWTRGLLRGGTGNDYPIQLFAQRGFAVLSMSRPPSAAANDSAVTTEMESSRVETRNWAERRNINSAINRGLDLLIAKGTADPAKLGITGLSDGGSAVRFALINSPRYAAAALSTCCVDDSSDEVVGPAWEKQSMEMGYPPAYPIDRQFWRPYSVALNAERISTPLLMQLADYELLMGIHAFTALRSAGQPVDLYFYPNEFHNKWQPEHRAAVFERNLDWFSFWMQGREDPSPASAKQFAYWRSLRDARDKAPPAASAPGSAP